MSDGLAVVVGETFINIRPKYDGNYHYASRRVKKFDLADGGIITVTEYGGEIFNTVETDAPWRVEQIEITGVDTHYPSFENWR